MNNDKSTYVKVLIPLKMRKSVTYRIDENIFNKKEEIFIGDWVNVNLRGKICQGIVEKILEKADFDEKKIKNIEEVLDIPRVRESEIKLWELISEYYMCSEGEVMKAACPQTLQVSRKYIQKLQKELQEKESTQDQQEKEHLQNGLEEEEPVKNLIHGEATLENSTLPELSPAQTKAYQEIKQAHENNKVAFLNGVTGSGKTEIYINLIVQSLKENKNALYLLPEIAISQQLSQRLKKIFKDRLLVFHSRQSITNRKKIISLLESQPNNQSYIILGLRSAIFLPFENLGLIIVDEEHDSSYKQSNPAPRYSGRDAAIFLSQIHKAKMLLGSATPSFESLYNINIGRYTEIKLVEKYHKAQEPETELVDMIKERRKNAVKGPFSLKLLKEIEQRIEKGEQTLIFRSRRAYSPLVQCSECGEIPRCPHCNIHLSYHRFKNSLDCHYCNYSQKVEEGYAPSAIETKENNIPEAALKCPKCGAYALKPLGAGTERIEEELQRLLPKARIGRFDADTTTKKAEQDKIIKDFACGNTDILIGTQMISKGFDFENLTLVAVIQAESVLAINDFRADEKALGLFIQLMGRAGRREKKGKLLIQTSQAEHSIFKGSENLMEERKNFNYPPYVRLIEITIRDKYEDRLWRRAKEIEGLVKAVGITEYVGPIAPPIDKNQGEYIAQIHISLKRNKLLPIIKKKLYDSIYELDPLTVIIDVDPL